MTWHAAEHRFRPQPENPRFCGVCWQAQDAIRHRAVYTDDRRWMRNPNAENPDRSHLESPSCAKIGCLPVEDQADRRVAEMPNARPVRVLPGITVSMTEAQRLRGVPRGDDAA